MDGQYLPTHANDALRDVFRTHRHLLPQTGATMELAVVRPEPAPARSFPVRAACQVWQDSLPDGKNGTGALLRDGAIDQAILGASRGRPALTVISDRQKTHGYCAVGGRRVRLVVNAGSSWPACDHAVPRPAIPSRAAEVIVLSGGGDSPGQSYLVRANRHQLIARLQKLEVMELAEPVEPGIWELSPRLEPSLKQLGRRLDTVSLTQKALGAEVASDRCRIS